MNQQSMAGKFLAVYGKDARINGERISIRSAAAVRSANGMIRDQGGSKSTSSCFYAETSQGEAVLESETLDAGRLIQEADAREDDRPFRHDEPYHYTGSICEEKSVTELKEIALDLARQFPASGRDIQITVRERMHTQWVESTDGLHVSDSADCLLTEIEQGGSSYLVMEDHLDPVLKVIAIREEMDAAPVQNLTEGRMRAVLSGEAVGYLLIAFWRMFTETGYTDGSVLKGRIGQRIASDLLSLTDQASGYKCRVDSEGTVGEDVRMIRNGILTDLMTTKNEADLFEPKGNAGRTASLVRGYGIRTVPRMLKVAPGTGTNRDLIRQCTDGVYIEEIYDPFHGADIASGRFSLPCAGAKIRNGQITGRVNGLSIEGSIRDLLASIEAVGQDMIPCVLPIAESYMCEAPAVLIRDLDIRVTP